MRMILLATILLSASVGVAEEPRPEEAWFYRSAGFESTNHASMGRAGDLVAFRLNTPDPVEKIVTWYGEKIGLSEEHGLMVAAKKGFATLDEPVNTDWQVYHDTDEQKNATMVVATAGASHAHVAIYHRTGFDSQHSVTVSIARVPTGTDIVVFYPKP